MNKDRVFLEYTADGSHTLFVPELNEHYHSVNGAIQESQHVFIEAGFHRCESTAISVFEVGFGTGLNAFLTLIEAEKSGKQVRYTSLELYPLDVEIVESLNYAAQTAPDKANIFNALHLAEWGVEIQITPYFSLKKINADLNHYVFNESYDLIYFDAFAPDKQPEMWNPVFFESLFANTKDGGILTTYCAKGVVRRSMQSAGYEVERIPGPPGKRQMLRASRKIVVLE